MTARLAVLATVLVITGAYLFYTLSNASYTLGCDYLTYDAALRRLLAGGAPYDVAITQTGTCGIYQYPPTFLWMLLPFALLPPEVALWAWIGLEVACVLAAVAVMPVRFEVRALVLALAGTSWPLLFSVKVGGVGALLLLLFAIAWRWRDRPAIVAASIAVGTLVKLQPALLLAWALLSGRLRALLLAAGMLGAVVVAGLLVDAGDWFDFLTVVRTLSGNALEVSLNFAPASVVLHLGVSAGLAWVFGVAHTLAVLAIVAVTARRVPGDAALLVAAVASQVVSPIMWDHYAMVLFLPIAWLLERRQWWALLIGAGLNAMFLLFVPPVAYLLAYDVILVAVPWLAWREMRETRAPARGATVPPVTAT